MSALPPKADIRERVLDVRFGPKADSCSAAKSVLFDHLIGAREHCRRNNETEAVAVLPPPTTLHKTAAVKKQKSKPEIT
jgi:hypothetical protein